MGRLRDERAESDGGSDAATMAVERERTRQVARIGSNLNQIARWANTHLDELAPVEVIAHLVAIERVLARLRGRGVGDAD